MSDLDNNLEINNENNNTSIDKREIMILVTEEDKTGSDVMKMSDFFTIAVQELSREFDYSDSLLSLDEFPLSEMSIINEAIKTIGVFRSPEFDLVPDFSSLSKDIQEKYKQGKLVLGESKQVKGNIRAVLVDAKTKVRVKDVTLKKVERVNNTNNISRDMLNQMQLRQILEKLDYMISEQSYLIDFSRNQAIIRPFLDARDYILKAQRQKNIIEQKMYLTKAAEGLQSAINAVYVDLNTIQNQLVIEVKKKWFKRLNRKVIDTDISRITVDTIILTKYVGLEMQVYHYLEDINSSRETLETYRSNINRFFEKGIISPDKSLAMFIHENVEYTEKNLDSWYYMEERFKPLINSSYDELEAKTIYVITGDEENE